MHHLKFMTDINIFKPRKTHLPPHWHEFIIGLTMSERKMVENMSKTLMSLILKLPGTY